ncbi:carbamoyltransferase C-terminal domain-containing protein [Magnetococcales bacterium HHB-1]
MSYGIGMNILGMHTGHDAAVALFQDGHLTAYCKEERLSRVKGDGRRLLLNAVEEVLTIADLSAEAIDAVCLSRMNLPIPYYRKTSRPIQDILKRLRGKSRSLAGEMVYLKERDPLKVIHAQKMKADLKLRADIPLTFCNHHYAHILGAFKFTTWPKDALFLSCDGGGDGTTYAAYGFDGEQLTCLYGGEEFLFDRHQKTSASIGLAYQWVTKHLGFRPNRHEGKITGLAAFGKPILSEALQKTFHIDDQGAFDSDFEDIEAFYQHMINLEPDISREDLAASIQDALEHLILRWVTILRRRFPARYLGLSGGVFSNVRLNQKVAELPGVEEVFVFPAMGDEGLPIGNCVDVEIKNKGLTQVRRYPFDHVYLGRRYKAEDLLNLAEKRGFAILRNDNPAPHVARLLKDHHIGAIYSQKMEMGPRALGARTILANPTDRGLNDSLNQRLNRTEFMPFAPYVLDKDAERIFHIDDINRQACRFMTITVDVERDYQDKIPAVVHVDGTARPQIIERKTNPLYYDILDHFQQQTQIPCLVNTSFNAHEEPIINTPQEALQALKDRRIDFLVTETGVITRMEQQQLLS